LRGSVAVLRNADPLQVANHETSQDYSVWLLPAVEEVLQASALALPDVDVYAVAAGPGSFTGVRVGLTTVKAWAEVYGRPIASVSRLEALATQATSQSGYVAAFTDAQRGQVFGALYRRTQDKLQRIEDEMVIAPDRFLSWAAENAGADRIQWISTDPDCLTGTQAWEARQAKNECIEAADPSLAPAIGRLGYQVALEKRTADALSLDANYVRRSDAEIFWKRGPKRT
jgi:tRNA threonylcarbamoyladenosine biosynthesis protein TsaB